LTGVKRMKDHAGKYWCLPCGEKDQLEKGRATGNLCSSCGETLATSKLTQLGGALYCDKCIQKGYRKSHGGTELTPLTGLKRLFAFGGDEQMAIRNIKAIVFVCILMAFSAVIVYLWS
jgi:hypothetical protein